MAFRLALVFMLSGLLCPPVQAQGLVWSLPPDGTWVRYGGEYSQTDVLPDVIPGTPNTESLQWQRQFTIKSVGTEPVDYQGKSVPGRWLEFDVVTGTLEQGRVVPGPGGRRIYKVLVPEPAVVGQAKDEKGIPVAFLPVIKGYHKIGEQATTPIQSGVMQVYPLITLLEHYDELEQAAEQATDPMVPLGQIEATQHSATKVFESRTARSTNEATLWRSDSVPFGLAKWEVTVRRERKEADQPRSEFEEMSTLTESMAAQATGTDAQSEISEQ